MEEPLPFVFFNRPIEFGKIVENFLAGFLDSGQFLFHLVSIGEQQGVTHRSGDDVDIVDHSVGSSNLGYFVVYHPIHFAVQGRKIAKAIAAQADEHEYHHDETQTQMCAYFREHKDYSK